MGPNASSLSSSSSVNAVGCGEASSTELAGEKSQTIRTLIEYARTHYQENPTEALSALLQAITLNSGQQSTNQVLEQLREELGNDIVDLVLDSQQQRTERARQVVDALLANEDTFLYQQGRQDLLRQTMEDGSSVTCSRCNDVVSSQRWQQHQKYWCSAIADDDLST